MRSDSLHGGALDAASSGVLPLLDSAFGFFVWAGHLIVIYAANAGACALDLTSGKPRVESLLVTALAAATVLAAALVGVHGLRRYREEPAPNTHGFLIRIAVGHDAIATLAILWQLVPIFMSPVCR